MIKKIKINGLTINYQETNPELEDTVIFIHGNSHSLKTFEHQFSDRNLNKYRLIALDLPGHGDSSRSNDYTIPAFAELLSSFIKEKALSNYILVGHSLGGHIAIESIDVSTPKGILLFGTPPVKEVFEPAKCFKANEELGLLFKEALAEDEVLRVIKTFYHSPVDTSIDVIDIKSVDPVFKRKLVESCGKNILKNEFVLLKNFTGIISIFHGAHDCYLQKEYLAELDLPLWKNQLIEFDSGHNIHKELPEKFNLELNDFAQEAFNL